MVLTGLKRYRSSSRRSSIWEEALKRPKVCQLFDWCLVNDADEFGINHRLANLKMTYTHTHSDFTPEILLMSANDFNDGPFSAGCCIFAEPGKDTGTLENILAPLMRVRQQSRQDAAQQFVLDHVTGTKIAPTPARGELKHAYSGWPAHHYGDSLAASSATAMLFIEKTWPIVQIAGAYANVLQRFKRSALSTRLMSGTPHH